MVDPYATYRQVERDLSLSDNICVHLHHGEDPDTTKAKILFKLLGNGFSFKSLIFFKNSMTKFRW